MKVWRQVSLRMKRARCDHLIYSGIPIQVLKTSTSVIPSLACAEGHANALLEYAKLYVVIRLYVGRVQLLVLSTRTLEGIPSLYLTYLPWISSCNTGNCGRCPVLSTPVSHAHKRKPFKFLGISLCITFFSG